MAVFLDVLDVHCSIRLKEVEDGKEKGNKPAAHTLMLRGEFESLGIGSPQEYLFSCPFANQIRYLGSNMQAMPYATQIVKLDRLIVLYITSNYQCKEICYILRQYDF